MSLTTEKKTEAYSEGMDVKMPVEGSADRRFAVDEVR